MKRKICTPTPVPVNLFPNCFQQIERICADSTTRVSACIASAEIWTPSTPRLSNQIARTIIRDEVRSKTLECQCYSPLGDQSDSGITYFSQVGCTPAIPESACDRFCFYATFSPEEVPGGIYTMVPDASFGYAILETLCSINGSVPCIFYPNQSRVQLVFVPGVPYFATTLYDSLNSYCPFLLNTQLMSSMEGEAYFLLRIFQTDNPDPIEVVFNLDGGVWGYDGEQLINGVTYHKYCFSSLLSSESCTFCTAFYGSSVTNPSFLSMEIGSLSGGSSYLYLNDDATTMQFAFKPYECRFFDDTIAKFPYRYCGSQFNLLWLSLEDYIADDFSSAVTLFDSSEVPDTCDCEIFSFLVANSGSYVLVFDDVNTGFRCLTATSFVPSNTNDLNYSSIGSQCLGRDANYYLSCTYLQEEVCEEETPALWKTFFVGSDNREAGITCEGCPAEYFEEANYLTPWSISLHVYADSTLGDHTIDSGSGITQRIRRFNDSGIGAGNPPALTPVYPNTFKDELGITFFQAHGSSTISFSWLPNSNDLEAAYDAVALLTGPDFTDSFYCCFIVEAFLTRCRSNEIIDSKFIVLFDAFFNGLNGQNITERTTFLSNHAGNEFIIRDGVGDDITLDILGVIGPVTIDNTIIETAIDWMAANLNEFQPVIAGMPYTVEFPTGGMRSTINCFNDEFVRYKVTGFATNIPQELP